MGVNKKLLEQMRQGKTAGIRELKAIGNPAIVVKEQQGKIDMLQERVTQLEQTVIRISNVIQIDYIERRRIK